MRFLSFQFVLRSTCKVDCLPKKPLFEYSNEGGACVCRAHLSSLTIPSERLLFIGLHEGRNCVLPRKPSVLITEGHSKSCLRISEVSYALVPVKRLFTVDLRPYTLLIHDCKVVHRVRVFLNCGPLHPLNSFGLISSSADTKFVATGKAQLSRRESSFCCSLVVVQCLMVILCYTAPSSIQITQTVMCRCKALFRCFLVPLGSLDRIKGIPEAFAIKIPENVLRFGNAVVSHLIEFVVIQVSATPAWWQVVIGTRSADRPKSGYADPIAREEVVSGNTQGTLH